MRSFRSAGQRTWISVSSWLLACTAPRDLHHHSPVLRVRVGQRRGTSWIGAQGTPARTRRSARGSQSNCINFASSNCFSASRCALRCGLVTKLGSLEFRRADQLAQLAEGAIVIC
jgi:hypothetical protein